MRIYDLAMYQKLREVYYRIISSLFSDSGFPITINGYNLRFVPRFYRYFPRTYESDSFDFIRNNVKPGSVCIDIGAHFGLYSIVLAKYLGCRVYSFEPTKFTGDVFRANIRYNNLGSLIEYIPKAVSSKSGTATFYVQDTEGAVSNSLVNYQHSEERKNEVTVEVVSIDETFDGVEYGFLKIDAEGAEFDVLLGARQTLARYRPKMILGLHPSPLKARGHTLKMVWDLLASLEYNCYSDNRSITEEEFCSRDELFDVVVLHSLLSPAGCP